MEPVCPKCGNANFAFKKDSVNHATLVGDTHMVTWVFCGECGCVVGCYP